jgi:hypothetical protein
MRYQNCFDLGLHFKMKRVLLKINANQFCYLYIFYFFISNNVWLAGAIKKFCVKQKTV